MSNWKKWIGKRLTFFQTEKGRRTLRVRVYLRPKKEGNILWYLAAKTKTGRWSKFILKLEEMEDLGLLFLVISRLCEKTLWMDQASCSKIQELLGVWRNLMRVPNKR